jgi:hypothetical protein
MAKKKGIGTIRPKRQAAIRRFSFLGVSAKDNSKQ